MQKQGASILTTQVRVDIAKDKLLALKNKKGKSLTKFLMEIQLKENKFKGIHVKTLGMRTMNRN